MNIFRKPSLRKYISVFKISIAQEFAYRANFIMWRIRNLFQILVVYFLWDNVFASPGRVVFGYTREKILTYVFLLIFVRAFVFSARSLEIGSEVGQGTLSNYLVRPISYFKYWLTRDLASKTLNISFAIVEFLFLIFLFKPQIFLQTNLTYLFLFIISVMFAMLFYFLLLLIISSIPFWMPEAAWGGQFFLFVILESLSGAMFPIDILPAIYQKILYLTPFPYLIFFPIQVYLGNFSIPFVFGGLSVAIIWLFILNFIMKSLWKRGMLAYQGTGR